MYKFGFSIRTRGGHKVDNIVIMARDFEEAERRLRQMYTQCEIVHRLETSADGRRSALDVDSLIGLIPGLNHPGPRVLNFADILKYNYIPLAKTIEVVLDVVKEALGSPVEIEFAVDLNKNSDYKASFYLLQIKPLIGNVTDYEIDLNKIDPGRILLYSEKEMGNGLVDNIHDVIFVDPDSFDKTRTDEMAVEMDKINSEMGKQGRKYILIGPGRWGTRDKWIGIPVVWPQISNAKVIVETSLEGFPLDASSGSHFFHNVTSMNVGYFCVQPEISKSYIKYDILRQQKNIRKTEYFTIVHFEKPLEVRMDGKKRISVISWNE